jgi:hypothetical protein
MIVVASYLAAASPFGSPAPVSAQSTSTVSTAPFRLYLSPSGADWRDGLTPATALRTLQGAHTKLLAYKPVIDQDVEVRIQYVPNQSYKWQSVRWTHTSPDHTISFMPSDYSYGENVSGIAGRPVFDADGLQEWFFELRAGKGEPTNIRFYYLRIQEYSSGAIAFVGGQTHDNRVSWNGYNTIYGCYFYRLGDKYFVPHGTLTSDTGIAGVDLGNSDHNLIRNNIFAYLENRSATAGHIHGVYLAHNSNNNVVVKNAFSYITGDPIKVRDFSNFNQIISNTFVRTGRTAFFHDAPSAGECSSWRNEFRYNTLQCGYSGLNITTFKDSPDPSLPRVFQGYDCPRIPEWLYTSGNQKSCPVLWSAGAASVR